MTLKLKGDLDILKMYLHIENKVLMTDMYRYYRGNEKITNIALKVKGQQLPTTGL